jgi:aspartyl/asparaginyl-tRNA synthetase
MALKAGDVVNNLVGRLDYKRVCGKKLAFLGLKPGPDQDQISGVVEDVAVVAQLKKLAQEQFVVIREGVVQEKQGKDGLLEVLVSSLEAVPPAEWEDMERSS